MTTFVEGAPGMTTFVEGGPGMTTFIEGGPSRELLYYLATPYRKYAAGIWAAARDAAQVAALLVDAGFVVYSPIAHTHELARYTKMAPEDTRWLDFDQPFMERCDGLMVAELPGWDTSSGVAHEIDWFSKAGRPILFVTVGDQADPGRVLRFSNRPERISR